MDVVKKLSIGLSLTCMMMLSSCSKEDVLVPEAQVGEVNESSALKTADLLGVVPVLPSTLGSTGFNVYPTGWERLAAGYSTDLQAFPTGTSNLSYMWGSALLPWAKPLPQIPGVQNIGSIVTITTSRSTSANSTGERSGVKTVIRNLKPGKKYTYTFYVASTVRNIAQVPFVPAYAKQAYVITSPSDGHSFATYIDLEGKNAQWVKQTVTFNAEDSQASLAFSGSTAQEGQIAYAHIFVDRNSIKQVN
jgi:hypothetical protein